MAEQEGELPAALEREPIVPDELHPYLEAFFELSPGRAIGMAPSGILLAEMEVYCRLHDVFDREKFVRMIRALDGEYLLFVSENATKAT